MTSKTPSHSFSIGDYFEITDGPWKGEKGKITRIGDILFGYVSCDGKKEERALPIWYLEKGMVKKIKGCDK